MTAVAKVADPDRMTPQGLRFAPTTSGDEPYYTSLHRSLSDDDMSMTQMAGALSAARCPVVLFGASVTHPKELRMSTNWKTRLPLALAVLMVVAALIVLARYQPARAERAADAAAYPRYTVIDTEGHNLIVTDNRSNTLFFYTIDKDKEIGSELRLRGTLDLNEVGKPSLKPKKPNAD